MAWPEAISDAATLIRNNDLQGSPQILLSDDGLLTIEWHRGNRGAMLLFAGDGIVTIAIRRPGVGYAENGEDAPLDGKLPQSFYDAIA